MAADTIDKVVESISDNILNQEGKEDTPKALCPGCGLFVQLDLSEKNITPGTRMFVTIVCPHCGDEFIPRGSKETFDPPQRNEPTRPSISRVVMSRRGEEEDED